MLRSLSRISIALGSSPRKFTNPIILIELTFASLRNSTKITILYQENGAATAFVLYAQFPKLVAMHFSEKWRRLFPFYAGFTTQEIADCHPKAITIVGGEPEYHLQLLEWMLSAIAGQGLKEWPEYDFADKPFHKYFHLRRSAQILGCVFLEDEFHLRMQALSSKRIHSDDVAAVYREVHPKSAMAEHLVQHVASFFIGKGVEHSNGPYWRLREEIPAFGDAVANMIGFRYHRDPELARAWNDAQLAKDEAVVGETFRALMEVKLEDVKKLGEGDEEEAKKKEEEEQKEAEAKEGEKEKKKVVVGVEAAEQVGKILDKNARRREKKRAKKAAAAAAAAKDDDAE